MNNFIECFFLYRRNHYAQHSQSVEAARRGAAARLESFGSAGAVDANSALCGLCEG